MEQEELFQRDLMRNEPQQNNNQNTTHNSTRDNNIKMNAGVSDMYDRLTLPAAEGVIGAAVEVFGKDIIDAIESKMSNEGYSKTDATFHIVQEYLKDDSAIDNLIEGKISEIVDDIAKDIFDSSGNDAKEPVATNGPSIDTSNINEKIDTLKEKYDGFYKRIDAATKISSHFNEGVNDLERVNASGDKKHLANGIKLKLTIEAYKEGIAINGKIPTFDDVLSSCKNFMQRDAFASLVENISDKLETLMEKEDFSLDKVTKEDNVEDFTEYKTSHNYVENNTENDNNTIPESEKDKVVTNSWGVSDTGTVTERMDKVDIRENKLCNPAFGSVAGIPIDRSNASLTYESRGKEITNDSKYIEYRITDEKGPVVGVVVTDKETDAKAVVDYDKKVIAVFGNEDTFKIGDNLSKDVSFKFSDFKVSEYSADKGIDKADATKTALVERYNTAVDTYKDVAQKEISCLKEQKTEINENKEFLESKYNEMNDTEKNSRFGNEVKDNVDRCDSLNEKIDARIEKINDYIDKADDFKESYASYKEGKAEVEEVFDKVISAENSAVSRSARFTTDGQTDGWKQGEMREGVSAFDSRDEIDYRETCDFVDDYDEIKEAYEKENNDTVETDDKNPDTVDKSADNDDKIPDSVDNVDSDSIDLDSNETVDKDDSVNTNESENSDAVDSKDNDTADNDVVADESDIDNDNNGAPDTEDNSTDTSKDTVGDNDIDNDTKDDTNNETTDNNAKDNDDTSLNDDIDDESTVEQGDVDNSDNADVVEKQQPEEQSVEVGKTDEEHQFEQEQDVEYDEQQSDTENNNDVFWGGEEPEIKKDNGDIYYNIEDYQKDDMFEDISVRGGIDEDEDVYNKRMEMEAMFDNADPLSYERPVIEEPQPPEYPRSDFDDCKNMKEGFEKIAGDNENLYSFEDFVDRFGDELSSAGGDTELMNSYLDVLESELSKKDPDAIRGELTYYVACHDVDGLCAGLDKIEKALEERGISEDKIATIIDSAADAYSFDPICSFTRSGDSFVIEIPISRDRVYEINDVEYTASAGDKIAIDVQYDPESGDSLRVATAFDDVGNPVEFHSDEDTRAFLSDVLKDVFGEKVSENFDKVCTNIEANYTEEKGITKLDILEAALSSDNMRDIIIDAKGDNEVRMDRVEERISGILEVKIEEMKELEARNLPEFVEEIDVSADDIFDSLFERGEFEEDLSE